VFRIESARFQTGPTGKGEKNAVTCRGQTIALSPRRKPTRLQLLAAATEDTTGGFKLTFGKSSATQEVEVPCWTGFVGQWDNRTWDRPFEEIDYRCEGHVTGITPGFIKRAPVAWFGTHRHHPAPGGGNEAYKFSYLFKIDLSTPEGTESLTLPDNPKIRVLAATLTSGDPAHVFPVAPLYDDFTNRKPVEFRFKYPPPPKPVFEGAKASGAVQTERAESFAALKLAHPSNTDYADAASGHGVEFRVFRGPDGDLYAPHPGSGAKGGVFARLNDGHVAQHDDDTSRCVWYDNEGRFVADLKKSTSVAAINTFSWHAANRAPQYFSVWGADGDTMPGAAISAGHSDGWTLLGTVDSRGLGNGGVHASRVTGEGGKPLGRYRWLLFVAEDVGQGTFFTEIDVEANDGP